jgi:CRISPR system Cascade subunit CasA
MATSIPSYDLTTEPWIPVLGLDGRSRLVSLRQLFDDAERLRSLAGDLPTTTFAIVRLLLAILHRATDGPSSEVHWRQLWRSLRLPAKDVHSYLDTVGDRFDLLHPTTPFFQVATLHTQKGDVGTLERLIADVPNGAPYLTARSGAALARLTFAEATRWLIHCQAYDVSGIKSGAVGDPRVKSGKGYPIGTGSTGGLGGVFLEGRNLRETLLLNLIPLGTPYLDANHEDDVPVWERPPHGPAEEEVSARGPHGPLTLYTWQSRRIRLTSEDGMVTGALVANGDKLEWDDRQRIEPMTAWRRSANKEKQAKRAPVYLPRQHDPARALWRGLDALLPATPESTTKAEAPARLVPAVSQWLARIRIAGGIPADFRVTTRAVGVVYGNQQSVVDEIYHDALTMNVQAFDAGGPLRTAIVDCVADADAAVVALRKLASNLCRAAGGSGRDAKDPPVAAANRAAEVAYGMLDQDFRAWLITVDHTSDPHLARQDWQGIALATVSRLGRDLVRQAGPKAWSGRDVDGTYINTAQADVWFRKALGQALPLTAPATAANRSSTDVESEDR